MFAGSCIGVILLVITLEALRRAGKEYDRYIVTQYKRSLPDPSSDSPTANIAKGPTASAAPACNAACTAACTAACNPVFRPSVFQHSLRALLHMLQFAVAYFVMLLAMYYNGYIIICIFIGAYIGYFIFGWESMNVSLGGRDRTQEQVTVCCG
ncbi:hypothetical protein M011DRAFT_471004 [Sporormia fimetaria CBS 119925]|uniref:Copper transport protein n=1 Tax=Sporormia fimetaria CBS 119925 TaxID=1340428 RepID=A0A6A6V0B0_9PLEO|nr:hypothetical protein M011DRAFT_471004 [Sporormia fimetaria CBS 119925]